MSFFKQPKPRSFHHEYLYVNERKEQLQQIERRAKKELEQGKKSGIQQEELHGIFRTNAARNEQKRRRTMGLGLAYIILILLVLLILLLVMRILAV